MNRAILLALLIATLFAGSSFMGMQNAYADGTLNQESSPFREGIGPTGSIALNTLRGQVFVPTANNLIAIDVGLRTDFSVGDTINIRIHPGNDPFTLPNADFERIGTIISIDGNIKHLHLDSLVPLVRGDPFILELVFSGTVIQWNFGGEANYPNGSSVFCNPPPTICGGGGFDFDFRTYFDLSVNGGPADTTPPVITLLGNNTETIIVNGVYVDAGATATDDEDGDITDKIVIGGLPIDTSSAGSFTITYDVKDSSGNVAQVTRTVFVVEAIPHGNVDQESSPFREGIGPTGFIRLNTLRGQVFVPTANNLTGIDVGLRTDFSGGDTINIRIHPGNDPFTLPNADFERIGTIVNIDGNTKHLHLDSPVPLVPGQPFILELVFSGTVIQWNIGSPANYAFGDSVFCNPPPTTCGGGGFDFDFRTYFDPEPEPEPEVKKSNGGDEAWKTRPTSGINYENGEQFVINGFGWNGNFLTVEFDHYQPFTKEELKIGERSTLTAKVYAPNGLASQSFGLGIRDIGSNDAEVELRANLNRDGSIDSIEVIQKTDVVDPETLTVSNEKVYCKDGDEEKLCDEIKFAFTLQESLQYEKAYSQHIDFKRRAGQVWVNHGFEITGEQITPMLSNMIPSNVRDEGLLKVTQVEKYSPYWVADDHRMFEMNSFGSFKQINQSFERFQDTGTAYTRMHSGFGGIIAYEQDRATQVFDSSEFISELPASFAYIFPETGERITEEMRQAMLLQEEIAKEVLAEMDKQDRRY